MALNDSIKRMKISELDINDTFFDSLKADYKGFSNWLISKKDKEAFVLEDDSHNLSGFLLLKDETESDNTINPKFELKRRLKISTFKIDAHGTILGQRFLSVIFNEAFNNNFDFIYVTLFEKQQGLIDLFEKFGFKKWGEKENGELVLYKDFEVTENPYKDFPRINLNENKYMLAIKPKFHSSMFPDSTLKTEKTHVIEDLSVTNTIEKIYISGIYNSRKLNSGDLLLIYRTSDGENAEYISVATSICTVVEVKNIGDFENLESFIKYCYKGSIFSEIELNSFWKNKKYPYIIKMLYNVPLRKRLIRKKLIEDVGLDRDERWSCIKLTDDQFNRVVEMGDVNESFIID